MEIILGFSILAELVYYICDRKQAKISENKLVISFMHIVQLFRISHLKTIWTYAKFLPLFLFSTYFTWTVY